MNTKNVFGIAALIIAVVFAMQIFQQVRVEAKQTSTETISTQAFEFAVLDFDGQNNVTWRIGGVVNPRTEPIRTTFRRLGGEGRGTFADLLNQIGLEGWNLIEKDSNLWIFSRPAR